MQRYETIEIPKQLAKQATIKQVEQGLICDLCGDESASKWQDEPYDATEVTVELVKGHNYPEGGYTTHTSIDLCPVCFVEKLLQWLKANGATPRTKEVDW